MIQKQFLWSAPDSTVKRNRIALIPAYNEADFIGSVVLQSLQHVDQVVVVDDGSTDGTAHIAGVAGAKVLSISKHVGKACAVSEGIRYIRGLNPTAVVMIDGNGQDDPSQIPHLLEPIERKVADLVIGSRIKKNEMIPIWRQHAPGLLILIAGLLMGAWVLQMQQATSLLAVGYGLVCLLLCIMGGVILATGLRGD